MCYFNNTNCKSIAQKLDPWKYVFGDYVFELDPVTQLRDDKQKGQKFCSIMLRGSKDSSTKKSKNRFLMGNVFLKNFYSVYDYDSQSVKLGVNVHSKDYARIYKYNQKDWANFKRELPTAEMKKK